MAFAGRLSLPLLIVFSMSVAGGCTSYQPFDSAAYLRDLYAQRVGAADARAIRVPFELDDSVRGYLAPRLKPSGSEVRRAADIVDFVFGDLGLQYRLQPTRDAVGTFRTREANCLSFVNLFIGISRLFRLDSFYVEVNDAQRWSHAQGLVVSQGHIVAGMRVGGELRTYDFLPYRPKAYRNFRPIDDLTAAAHYYNNLSAEALLGGDLDQALVHAETATAIAPTFSKALNNLGLCHARRGDVAGAERIYRRGLEIEPEDPGLLTNLMRLFQESGRRDEIEALAQRLEELEIASPAFYVFRGREALFAGDPERALGHLRQALRIESELPDVHVALAEAYVALGDVERARHHLQRALRLDATHAAARKLLTMVGER
jgi:tetratricopeptide (TPR) repeat protein